MASLTTNNAGAKAVVRKKEPTGANPLWSAAVRVDGNGQ